VKHPGRSKLPRVPFDTDPDIDFLYRFEANYIGPFHERFPDDQLGAGYMLGLIADLAFVPADGGRLVPASKAEVFREFMLPVDYDPIALEGGSLPPKHETLESADAALAFLVEQGMVVVTGDEIVVRLASGVAHRPSP
jgi:hypothetical protein